MIIREYNAICNLGNDINEVFKEALLGNAEKFTIVDSRRLAFIDTELPKIQNEDYNTRANRIVLKVLEPLNINELDKKTTAVVVATTNSGVEEYEISKNPKHFQIGNSAEFVHNYFGFDNFYTSVSTACSSGIKAFSIAKQLLEKNIAENILVVGVDAITNLPIYGFDSLEILSKKPTNPFSKNRCGINIGEGAAAFILSKKRKKSEDEIEICGLGETTDCYHATTPDPDGVEAYNAIKIALGDIKPEDVDYINLHGTGTIANDLMEARAIHKIFEDKVPAGSTKPLTGHCLGAAASVETALCCKLLDAQNSCEGRVFPHIYDGEYDTNLPTIWLADKNTKVCKIKTCLIISFGFSGTNCAMLLRKNTQDKSV